MHNGDVLQRDGLGVTLKTLHEFEYRRFPQIDANSTRINLK